MSNPKINGVNVGGVDFDIGGSSVLSFDTYDDYLAARKAGNVPVGSPVFIKEGSQTIITATQVTYGDTSVKAALDQVKDDLSDNNVSFKFGFDGTNYGYYKDGADTVTPFNPSMGACVYTTSTSSSLATIRIITGNKTTYNNDNIGHTSALSGLEYDLFTLKYVDLNWTITLKRNCYVNGVLRLSGETFNWAYTAVNYYLIIPA